MILESMDKFSQEAYPTDEEGNALNTYPTTRSLIEAQALAIIVQATTLMAFIKPKVMTNKAISDSLLDDCMRAAMLKFQLPSGRWTTTNHFELFKIWFLESDEVKQKLCGN
jgi:hypothetical protein